VAWSGRSSSSDEVKDIELPQLARAPAVLAGCIEKVRGFGIPAKSSVLRHHTCSNVSTGPRRTGAAEGMHAITTV